MQKHPTAPRPESAAAAPRQPPSQRAVPHPAPHPAQHAPRRRSDGEEPHSQTHFEQGLPNVRMPDVSQPPRRAASTAGPAAGQPGVPRPGPTARNQSDVTARRPPTGVPVSGRNLTAGSVPQGGGASVGAPEQRPKPRPVAQPSPGSEYGNIMRAVALPIRVGSVDSTELNAVIEKEDDKTGVLNKIGFGSRASRRLVSMNSEASSYEDNGPVSKQSSKRFLKRGNSASSSASSVSSGAGGESQSLPTSPTSARKSTTTPMVWDESVELAHKRAALRPRSAKMEMDMRRQPPLRDVPYRRNWAMDPLALPHNAIRRELIDCYVMLYAMDFRREELGQKDYEMFFGWWRVFSTFVVHYLDAEEEVLYPWIESRIKLTGLLAADKREKIKEHLKYVLFLIAKSEAKLYTSQLEFEPLYVLKRAVDKVALLTQEYFGYEERSLPRMIASNFKESEKRDLDRDMVNFFLKGPSPGSDVVILTRWLQPDERDPKKLLEWRYDNLGPVNWTRYGVWWKTVNGKHLAVPVYFKAKRDFYKAELRQKDILQRENPELYRKKYGRADAEREKLLNSVASAEPSEGNEDGVVSSGRDAELEAQLGGDAAVTLVSPKQAAAAAEAAAASQAAAAAQAKGDAGASATALADSSGGMRDSGVFSSSASMVSRRSFVLSAEGKRELDALVDKAAKLNEYLASLDKKYGSGLDATYGRDDDILSLPPGQYSDSGAELPDKLSLADDSGYQMDVKFEPRSYTSSAKSDMFDMKNAMNDIDLDMDRLSLADEGEGFDVGNLDLDQYLEFDDALSYSGLKF